MVKPSNVSSPAFQAVHIMTSHYVTESYICIKYAQLIVWHMRMQVAQLLCCY